MQILVQTTTPAHEVVEEVLLAILLTKQSEFKRTVDKNYDTVFTVYDDNISSIKIKQEEVEIKYADKTKKILDYSINSTNLALNLLDEFMDVPYSIYDNFIDIGDNVVNISKLLANKHNPPESFTNKLKKFFGMRIATFLFLLFVTFAQAQSDPFVTPACLAATQINDVNGVVDYDPYNLNKVSFTFENNVVVEVNKDEHTFTIYDPTLTGPIAYDAISFGWKTDYVRVVNVNGGKNWYEVDFLNNEVRHYFKGKLAKTYKN